MLINLSNHLSEKWSKKQLDAATAYGEIVDLPFPEINLFCTSEEIDKLVDYYFEQIKQYKDPVVMVQGEFIFTYRMINRLKQSGIKAIAGRSDRRTIEYIDDMGYTARRSEFEFAGFMEY